MDTLVDLLLTRARERPSHPAIEQGANQLSYAGLVAAATVCASAARHAGVRRGDRVVVLLPRGRSAAAALFGITALGAVAVPMAENATAAEVARVAADCGAGVVVSAGRRAQLVPAGAVVVDPDAGADHPSALADGTDLLRGADGDRPIGRDLALLLYTSGSTGPPKGVMVTHANLLAGADSVTEYLGLRPDDRLLSVLPWSFDYGLNQLIGAVRVGATVVVGQAALMPALCRTLREARCTVFAAVPALWTLLVGDSSPFLDLDLPDLRLITNSGGRFPVPVIAAIRARHPHVRVFSMYGLTEAFRSTYLDPELVDTVPDSIGRAIPGAECLVVREDGGECGPDEVGQLVHRGPTVALGYWGRPDATAAVFRPHPRPLPGAVPETVVYSGDWVSRSADGLLYYEGRRDEQFKSRGIRVNPSQIEAAIVEARIAREVVVVGVLDERRGDSDVVAIVAEAVSADPDVVVARCAAVLPVHWVPSRVLVLDELPRNGNGKFDRAALKADLVSGAMS